MLIVIACWVVSMVSGLMWARWWTAVCCLVTGMVFLWTQAPAFGAPGVWVQLAVLTGSPWLLAAAQERDARALKALHADEAVRMSRFSESARSLLSLQNANHLMETQIVEIGEVYHVTKETSRALHFEELFAAVLEIAPRLLHASGLRLIDLTQEPPQMLRAVRSADGAMGAVPDPAEPEDVEQAIIREAAASPASLGSHAQLLTGGEAPSGAGQVAWAPLRREQKAVGVVAADGLPDAQLKTLTIVANQLSLQLSRIHLYQRVEALAVTDALTGLSVRGHFMERAREELIRSKRHTLACTVLMVDLDLFKQKNDTYGHLVGDVVLKDVARLLQRNLREVDLIGRFGGEEFVLLLIETPADQAMPVAQRLKQLVEVHPIRAYDELLSQTISIGLAAFPEHGQTLEALIERADQALYAAKHAGRNRVVRWSETMGKTGLA